ncbi:hypothetical protein [Actinoplanes sp. NPDC020271]|uniref:hypothetical protein n=1 Tax=Actinoplanes sp. NPDC020271 TaxID=3363896 RepID=UPI0037BCBE4D
MTSTVDGRPVTAAREGTMSVLPVTDGDRPVGAWIVGPDEVVYRPVVDVNRLVAAALAATGAVVIAVAVSAGARNRPAVGAVTMGPGGWLSIKRAGCPAPRSAGSRPWWARLLKAYRINRG